MTMTEEDKEWVKLVARELAFAVNKEVIVEHIKSCPHGQALLGSKWFLVGVCIGCSIAGSGISLALAKIIMAL